MYPNFLLKQAAINPNRSALVFKNRNWTFAELNIDAKIFASKLVSIGIEKNSRVAILSPSNEKMVITIHALWQLSCEVVLLNERLTDMEIKYQLEDCQASYVLVDESYVNKIEHKNAFTIQHISLEKCTDFTPEEFWDDIQTLSIMYTSGTTGFPKGVKQTVKNHATNAFSSNILMGIREGESWLCTMPLFHISGLSILIRSVLFGIEVRLYEKFDVQVVVDDLVFGKVTRMSVVATTLQRIVEELEFRGKQVDSKFKGMLAGGGPIPQSYIERAAKCGISVMQTYGMTETCSQTATLQPNEALMKIGSCGKPLFLSDIKIHQETGEILVKGDHVTSGYIGKYIDVSPLQNGWLATGDIGYFDEDGYLYVLDRRSDLIISGGENVYPAEIESTLLRVSGIKDAGVVGRQDEKWGQVPVAYLVVENDFSLTTAENFCKEHLASYKIPKEWYIVPTLPRNAANKLLRKELRQWQTLKS